jgi:hypothetical protein
MTIQIDTREHKKEAQRIVEQFEQLGVSYFRSKLYVGDYQSLDNPRLVVDRKKDLLELCGNVTQQHERFVAELQRGIKAGIKIVILCENGDGIRSLEDVWFWRNPRLDIMDWKVINNRPVQVPKYPRATTGQQLYKSLNTIVKEYNTAVMFCDKSETGAMISKILGGEIIV